MTAGNQKAREMGEIRSVNLSNGSRMSFLSGILDKNPLIVSAVSSISIKISKTEINIGETIKGDRLTSKMQEK